MTRGELSFYMESTTPHWLFDLCNNTYNFTETISPNQIKNDFITYKKCQCTRITEIECKKVKEIIKKNPSKITSYTFSHHLPCFEVHFEYITKL